MPTSPEQIQLALQKTEKIEQAAQAAGLRIIFDLREGVALAATLYGMKLCWSIDLNAENEWDRYFYAHLHFSLLVEYKVKSNASRNSVVSISYASHKDEWREVAWWYDEKKLSDRSIALLKKLELGEPMIDSKVTEVEALSRISRIIKEVVSMG